MQKNDGVSAYPFLTNIIDTRRLEKWLELIADQAAKMTISAETIPFVAESVIELEEMGIHFTANVAFDSYMHVPSCEKITGAYHDGMHWLYAVESRKASFEMEQQR
ncbi:MAG: hypothetical protein NT166_00370 [Candidatus Aminicenantes bacterium]|nr:hypothetical protein [Candidatus Aminicenantes bacterium]